MNYMNKLITERNDVTIRPLHYAMNYDSCVLTFYQLTHWHSVLYMYICVCVYIYIYMCVCVCIYIYMCVCVYIYTQCDA